MYLLSKLLHFFNLFFLKQDNVECSSLTKYQPLYLPIADTSMIYIISQLKCGIITISNATEGFLIPYMSKPFYAGVLVSE